MKNSYLLISGVDLTWSPISDDSKHMVWKSFYHSLISLSSWPLDALCMQQRFIPLLCRHWLASIRWRFSVAPCLLPRFNHAYYDSGSCWPAIEKTLDAGIDRVWICSGQVGDLSYPVIVVSSDKEMERSVFQTGTNQVSADNWSDLLVPKGLTLFGKFLNRKEEGVIHG